MHLNIFVSQNCFLYCKGCYSFSRIENCNQIVETKKIIDFLKYAYKRGIKKITLCGGDPLTRHDIMSLIKQIKNIGFYISIDTVGTSIIRDIKVNNNVIIKKIGAKNLSKLVDEIGIPIDGSSTEVIKKFRQTKFDILSEQLQICNELMKYNANICINTVVHKENLNDGKLLCNLINKLDYIKKWQLFRFAPMGKYGYLNRKIFEITEDEFEKYKQIILNKCLRKEIVEFKGYESRNNKYIMIDNSGLAWIPEYSQESFDNKLEDIEQRNILGNIKNKSDWEYICNFLV